MFNIKSYYINFVYPSNLTLAEIPIVLVLNMAAIICHAHHSNNS